MSINKEKYDERALLGNEKSTVYKKEVSNNFCCVYIQTILIALMILFFFIFFTSIIVILFFSLNKGGVISIGSLFRDTNVNCGYSCAQICLGSEMKECFDNCYRSCNSNGGKFNKGVFSHYLQPNAVQHVGVTVSNLTRTTNFFVEMLGKQMFFFKISN